MNNKIKQLSLLSLMLLMGTSALASDIAMNTARLQAMDKITGRVSEISVPVNGLANFGSFSILVRKCVTKPAEETPENTAFIDVVDNYKTANPVNIFKGWMFSSTPALNAVEHPIYDIWLLECYNSKHDKKELLNEDQLALRDEIPMQRQEKIEISTSLIDEKINDSSAEQTPSANETIEQQEDDEQFASEGEEFVEEQTSTDIPQKTTTSAVAEQ